MFKNRKAVSPVIATVILVAVAITISVAVAYWMGGISSQYTKFEKVEVSSAICEQDTGGWNITVKLKNTGTAQATIKNCFVNDFELGYGAAGVVAGTAAVDFAATGLPMASGANATVILYISNTYKSYTSGTTINMKFHSAGGMDYLKLIELV
jgi:flagellin-like protein